MGSLDAESNSIIDETTLKIGDVIRLKSGGPNLTVWSFRNTQFEKLVDVEWFVNDILYRDAFDIRCIVKKLPNGGEMTWAA